MIDKEPMTKEEEFEEACRRGLYTIAFVLILLNTSYAQDMKLVGYEEVPDCDYPSARVCVPDEHGIDHCVILLNQNCK